MKPVDRSEVLDLGAYEGIRDHYRRRMVAQKKARRLQLGEHMTVLFENHDTALFQIQEMLRTERITRESAIAHEIETYNELVPLESELSATVFVEYPVEEERDRMLVALAGLEKCFYVEVGGTRFEGQSDARGTRTDRTTAVHYVKFPLSSEAARAFVEGASITVGVDHLAYRVSVAPGEALTGELREDLV